MIAKLLCRFLGHNVDARTAIYRDEGGQSHWQCTRCECNQHGVPVARGWLRYTVIPNEIIPRGFGIAWIDWRSGKAMAMPIPLNLLVAAILRAYHWCHYPRQLVDDPHAAYQQGFRDGQRGDA